jgi:hypothetical protein
VVDCLADSEGAVCRAADRRYLSQQLTKGPPIAFDCLKAAEPFTKSGRKAGDKRRPLAAVVDKVPNKPSGKAYGKTDQDACPEHVKLRSEPARTMLRCGGNIAASQHISQL